MRVPALLVLALLAGPAAAAPARIEVHEWYGAMAFTADGRYLVAGSDQGLVSWELPTGKRRELAALDGAPLLVEAGPAPGEVTLVTGAGRISHHAAGVAVSPEADAPAPEADEPGPEVLATAKGGTLRVSYDEAAKRLEVRGPAGSLAMALDRPEAPDAVRISADGRILVVDGEEALEVFAVAGGKPLGRIPEPGSTDAVALAPTGDRIATWAGSTVWFWSPSGDGTWARMDHLGEVDRVVFSRDGRRAISGTDSGDVVLWDLVSRTVVRFREPDGAAIRGLALAPDGIGVAIQADDFVELWVPDWVGSVQPQRVVTVPLDLAASESGPLATMPGFESRGRVSRSGAVSDLALAADGGLWIAYDEGSLLHVGADGGEDEDALAEAGPGLKVAASPTGAWVAFGGATRALGRLGSGEGAEPVPLAGLPAPIFALASPAGSGSLVAATPDGLAMVAPGKGGRTGAIRLDGAPIRALVPFPAGGRLAVGGDDGKVRLVDLATGRATRTLTTHGGAVTGLAVSPDGRLLAAASTGLLDRTVKLFDLGSGAELLRLVGFPRPPGAVGFSADGRHLVVAGGPDSLLFWDLAAHRFAGYLETMPEDVGVLVVDPKGGSLAAGTTEGVVEVWGHGPAPGSAGPGAQNQTR